MEACSAWHEALESSVWQRDEVDASGMEKAGEQRDEGEYEVSGDERGAARGYELSKDEGHEA